MSPLKKKQQTHTKTNKHQKSHNNLKTEREKSDGEGQEHLRKNIGLSSVPRKVSQIYSNKSF